MNSNPVDIALDKNTAFVKVRGRGIFLISHSIKQWLLKQIESGYSHVVVDTSECRTIDSTFMGMLTGVSLRLKKTGKEPLVLANITPHNKRLLETLGLDKLLLLKDPYEIDSSINWEELPIELLGKMATTKYMLEAHKQLLNTGTIAAKQFQNVYKLLEDDLDRQKKKKEGLTNQ